MCFRNAKSLLPALLICALMLFLPALAHAATVSGTVYNDKSLDGVLAGKGGVGNVSLTLERADGTLYETSTARDGTYLIENVAPGSYRVTSTLPNAYVPTVYAGDNALLPAQGNDAATDWFELDESGRTVNLGLSKTSVYFSFYAFEDENANGGRMMSEPVIKGVEVRVIALVGDREIAVASGETGRDGALLIRDLSPATYKISVTLPENYIVGPLGTKINGFYNCINPSEGQEGESDYIELAKGSLSMGIGAVRTGAAQGVVWYDENLNGLKDAGEGGFADAVVTLTNADMNLTRTARVQPDGSFMFKELQPAEYEFRVALPDGFMFTLPGGDSQFTDGYTNVQSSKVIVIAEDTAGIRPAGVMPATSLTVSFYRDDDADGARGADEAPYVGARVEAVAGGEVVASAVSDASGVAVIPILRGGDVTVTAYVNEGDAFSNAGDQNDFVTIGAKTKASVIVSLPHAENTTLNAAVTLPASVSGTLFADDDNDGLFGASEIGVAGFTVQAVDARGNVVSETQTDENGHYTLTGLLPDPHKVRFLLPDPYIASPYVLGAPDTANAIVSQTAEMGETDVYALDPGAALQSVNGGVFKAGTVSGYVYQNKNHDGLMTNEGGMPGVRVTLLGASGVPYSDYTVAVTDETGMFYIKGLLPGSYSVMYTLGADMLFASTDDDAVYSAPFTSGMGTETTVDPIGAVQTATVSGTVTHLGEPVEAAITFTGRNYGTNLTISSAGGAFSAALLRPDEYDVVVELPDMYVFALDTCALVPAKADCVSTSELTLNAGERVQDQTITAALPAFIQGLFYYDENNSRGREADETLIDGFQFELLDAAGNTVETPITDIDGQFGTAALIPGDYAIRVTLGDQILVNPGASQVGNVWTLPLSVADGETLDTLTVGILTFGALSGQVWSMDGSTNGLGGLSVELYAASSPDAPKMTATTDETGAFVMTQLYPDEYFVKMALPKDHMYARTADASDKSSLILADTDSGKDGRSDVFYLAMGEHMENADIGIGAKGEIGDFAWLDENKNGMQDLGEPGIPGIKIELYQYGELAAQIETDVYGHYYMTDLYPGEYTMRVTMHKELKATARETEFPLVSSILPEDDDLTVEVQGVVVPSGTRDFNMDLGFVLRKKDVYPSAMESTPTIDWSYGGTKND